jgi:Cytochrome c7 and related cytochrome c
MKFLFALLLSVLVLLSATRAHAQFLSPGALSKAHATVDGDDKCNECHASGKRIDTAGCLKCHNDIGARIAAGAGLHGNEYKGKACESCHGEHMGAGARIVRWDPKAFNHAQSGWPLEDAHAKVACEKCHTKSNARGAKTYLGLSKECVSCHKDPHTGRFGNGCTTCHNQVKWTDLTLGRFDHNTARYPLKGSHAKVACAKCHQEPPKYFGLAFDKCTDCHKDVHNGKLGQECIKCHNEITWKGKDVKFDNAFHPGVSLANGHAPVKCAACHDKGSMVAPTRGVECVSCHKSSHKAPFGRGCNSCHATILWTGLARSIGLSAHTKTAYALTGKHLDAACVTCHKLSETADQRYRKLRFERCIDCHKDNHEGEFASRSSGECAPCHATSGFKPTLFGAIAHETTKYPLAGKHNAVACLGCHKNPAPRTSLRVAKQACADCHENPHGTQFATEMNRGGCATCHEVSGWQKAKFDHSTWPLTGVHATAACDSCHHPSPEDRKVGKGASYRGVPRLCGGCHDDLHAGQFRTSNPVRECDACHTTKAFKIPSFAHTKLTGYALTGQHEKVKCAGCHESAKLASGLETVRWRIPFKSCIDCHASPHGGAKR